MNNHRFPRIAYLIMGFSVLLLCLSACSGVRRVAVVAIKYPDAFRQECADRYPVKDSIITSTIYKQGEIRYLPGDTVEADCGELFASYMVQTKGVIPPTPANRYLKVPCPPQPVRVDTFFNTTVKQVENTAKVQGLEKEAKKMHAMVLVFAILAGLELFYICYLRLFRHRAE